MFGSNLNRSPFSLFIRIYFIVLFDGLNKLVTSRNLIFVSCVVFSPIQNSNNSGTISKKHCQVYLISYLIWTMNICFMYSTFEESERKFMVCLHFV